MKVWIRRLFILIIMIIFLVAFSGSYSALSIDNLSTVVAIAIDTSDTNQLRMSFQFTNASSVSESGSTEQSPSIIYSIDCSSISNGINLMNTYIGKELNLSHCKIIAFSEELAMSGISEEVYTLFNNAQIRPSTNVVITKCTAKYYLENSKPLAENLLTKHYEIFANSSKSTGYTVNATLGEFFSSLICDSCEGYAILGGVSSEDNETTTNIDSQKDSSNKANSSSLTGKATSENIGMAVEKVGFFRQVFGTAFKEEPPGVCIVGQVEFNLVPEPVSLQPPVKLLDKGDVVLQRSDVAVRLVVRGYLPDAGIALIIYQMGHHCRERLCEFPFVLRL